MATALVATTALLIAAGCAPQAESPDRSEAPVLTGPYLGQSPPGAEAKLFAPGIVTTGVPTRDVAMTPDGKEIYFGAVVGPYTYTAILVTRELDGRWTEPEVTPFSANPQWMDLEPFITPDGGKFYFLSNRPLEAGGPVGNQDVWVMDRTADGWGEPYNFGPPVNSDAGEYFPSVTRDGTIYFTREAAGGASAIWRSRRIDGAYQEPERLGPEVNSGPSQFNAFIAPDESYLIVCVLGREDSVGSVDYYVTYRREDDVWSDPINLGEKINTPGGNEYSPYVSPDGKYFFFMSSRTRPQAESPPEALTRARLWELYTEPRHGSPDIHWIDAGFLAELRPDPQ